MKIANQNYLSPVVIVLTYKHQFLITLPNTCIIYLYYISLYLVEMGFTVVK